MAHYPSFQMCWIMKTSLSQIYNAFCQLIKLSRFLSLCVRVYMCVCVIVCVFVIVCVCVWLCVCAPTFICRVFGHAVNQKHTKNLLTWCVRWSGCASMTQKFSGALARDSLSRWLYPSPPVLGNLPRHLGSVWASAQFPEGHLCCTERFIVNKRKRQCPNVSVVV